MWYLCKSVKYTVLNLYNSTEIIEFFSFVSSLAVGSSLSVYDDSIAEDSIRQNHICYWIGITWILIVIIQHKNFNICTEVYLRHTSTHRFQSYSGKHFGVLLTNNSAPPWRLREKHECYDQTFAVLLTLIYLSYTGGTRKPEHTFLLPWIYGGALFQ